MALRVHNEIRRIHYTNTLVQKKKIDLIVVCGNTQTIILPYVLWRCIHMHDKIRFRSLLKKKTALRCTMASLLYFSELNWSKLEISPQWVDKNKYKLQEAFLGSKSCLCKKSKKYPENSFKAKIFSNSFFLRISQWYIWTFRIFLNQLMKQKLVHNVLRNLANGFEWWFFKICLGTSQELQDWFLNIFWTNQWNKKKGYYYPKHEKNVLQNATP